MPAIIILVLALASFTLLVRPGSSGPGAGAEAEARAAHLLVAHQAALDSIRVSGNPGAGRLPPGFVSFPDWFAASGAFEAGTDGSTVTATWMDTDPRLWGEVAAALARRKSIKAAVGVVDRSGGAVSVVAPFDGTPVRYSGLGSALSGAPEGAPVTMRGIPIWPWDLAASRRRASSACIIPGAQGWVP